MQENGLNWHFLTSILLFFVPEFGAKLLKYLLKRLRYVVYGTTVKKICH